jgi:hypothetical protein
MTGNTALLTMAEAAELARISKSHLSKLSRGLVHGVRPLPVIRLGRRVLVRHEVLFQWLSQQGSSSI